MIVGSVILLLAALALRPGPAEGFNLDTRAPIVKAVTDHGRGARAKTTKTMSANTEGVTGGGSRDSTCLCDEAQRYRETPAQGCEITEADDACAEV